MKLFIIFFLFTFVAFAQKGEIIESVITYQLSWKKDTSNLKNISKEYFVLSIGKEGTSCFESYLYSLADSVQLAQMREVETTKAIDMRNYPKKSAFKYRVFKSEGKIQVEETVANTKYVYPSVFNSQNWEISNKQDTVAGFWSQMATLNYNGRDFEAWFTLDIPISEGPYVFSGLPGLIVQLTDTENHYAFTLSEIGMGDSNKIVRQPNKKALVSTFEKVSEIKKRERSNPWPTDALPETFYTSRQVEAIKELRRQNNNPLERNQ